MVKSKLFLQLPQSSCVNTRWFLASLLINPYTNILTGCVSSYDCEMDSVLLIVLPCWLPHHVDLLFCELALPHFGNAPPSLPHISLKPIYMHSSEKTACCESYWSAPQNLLKVQDLLSLACCVVLFYAPQRQPLSFAFIFISTHSRQKPVHV